MENWKNNVVISYLNSNPTKFIDLTIIKLLTFVFPYAMSNTQIYRNILEGLFGKIETPGKFEWQSAYFANEDWYDYYKVMNNSGSIIGYDDKRFYNQPYNNAGKQIGEYIDDYTKFIYNDGRESTIL